MSPNTDLTADVSAELFWDPKVDNTAIAVSADNGDVTLRGTVGSLREKHQAKKAAQRVYGVTHVNNTLQIRLPTTHMRNDADLRSDVLQALILDSLIPNTVDATVNDSYVTLTGTVNWRYQREEAESVATAIAGILDVLNNIGLQPPGPNPIDVQNSINQAFKRNAAFDADDLQVLTDNDTLTIKGSVRSWAEHDEAINAAWAAPGVTTVHDDMTIAY